ncbi:MAG: 5-formyltetrahydrofolate cyclo-ligase [Nitrospira sp.]|nr:5-formyltetrahydrofolate cyclo-ligase [Nitrospira sp.]
MNIKVKESAKTQLTKKLLRSKILLKLKTQKEEDRERKSRIIKEKLFKDTVFKKAKKIMFYIAFGGEVDTKEMILEARKIGKTVAVPVCKTRRTIEPCLLGAGLKLAKGLYCVKEPVIKRMVDLENLDLIIVPGLAFDKLGNRLGRGMGCYDHFLKRSPGGTPSIGLAFDFQILPSIPTTKRDSSVTKVLFA